MSKTVSTCLLETNQIQGKPQENVFFHSLYRTEPEFISEFLRTARSTSPIQICAIFSAVGPDNLSAVLNIELNKELAAIVADTQKQPVLDFDAFSNRVVNTLNSKVCSYIVAKGGTPIKVSMTLMAIEGDILRLIHIGNTKAVLYRDNKIMALTEEQTVAHRYVQMGAITPDQEKTHPEKDTLTQYLGKMPQDGELVPEKKVNIKLRDNDEIYLMGNGISKAIPQQMRNMVICKPLSTEDKAREIIISAVNYGVKYGLSLVAMKIESTFLLPGDAVIASNLPMDSQVSTDVKSDEEDEEDPYMPFNEPKKDSSVYDDEDVDSETTTFNAGKPGKKSSSGKYSSNAKPNDNKSSKVKVVLVDVAIVVGILALFIGIGFGTSYFIMSKKGWISTEETTQIEIVETTVAEVIEIDTNAYYEEQHILYAINDNVKILAEAAQDSEDIAILQTNEPVVVIGEDETSLYYLCLYNDQQGYILKPLLSEFEVEETIESTIETAQTSIPTGGQPTVQQTTANTEPVQVDPTQTEPAVTETSNTDATSSESSSTDITESSNDSSTTTSTDNTSETTASTSETSETSASESTTESTTAQTEPVQIDPVVTDPPADPAPVDPAPEVSPDA